MGSWGDSPNTILVARSQSVGCEKTSATLKHIPCSWASRTSRMTLMESPPSSWRKLSSAPMAQGASPRVVAHNSRRVFSKWVCGDLFTRSVSVCRCMGCVNSSIDSIAPISRSWLRLTFPAARRGSIGRRIYADGHM